ncbi:sal-like protein 1 [Acanthaster planci]|uniref:Sal-like protein 1 n=1 Tax=Acanthaster planci TaxID=133434 RepID=A0A8B7XL83_ACAPL|nr:sal-like protein 1 [Acanthaster planci]XP_022080881.1 sal-like protein 1 [Acanthaster planci]XP_022080882.1 sal-like protein 1 [Acanthaster planci]XP_022080883.1 sal-like protein 1 [Acanthaster planci]XP_022080884.1 sal-like protein 1 [Acanthaster planci]XP_022080885.1 sal-like protein 1 [Acanthaster planci]XP_022080886.1 sal-like protein 1 [Acanthaster planci]XP_022080887.1 sal-like protein 1 [Acanthaster planci]
MDEATEAEVVSDSLPGSEEGDLDIDLELSNRLEDTIKQERVEEEEVDEEGEEEDRLEAAASQESQGSPTEKSGAKAAEAPAATAAGAAAGGQKSLTGYQCRLCTVLLSSQGALDEHMNIHSGSRPYKCRECNFSCSLQNTLVQHLAVHSHPRADMNSQLWLEQPQQQPAQPAVYNNHHHQADRQAPELHPPVPLPPRMPLPENHAPSLPFSTAVEQALMPSGLPSFPDQGKVFQCKLCTHVSPTKTHLNEHMNVHTGKKPYKCLVCGFSSAFRSSLMRHLIVHTGTSKQFKCDSCHYQTPYKCNLQAHKRKRHNSNSLDSLDMNYPPVTSQNQTPLEDSPPLQTHGKLFSSEEQARYLMQSELTNSAHPTHQSHENSGNRRHSLSPDDHDSSASNDTHESARITNSHVPLLKSGDASRYNSDGSVVPQSPEPPVLEKNSLVSNAEMTDRPKSGEALDFSSPSMSNNVHDLITNASTTQSAISMLSNSVSSASSALGLPSGASFTSSVPNSMATSIPSTSPQHPLTEISVITPLQWAGAGFPIYRRKKEGGARKRKRTPLPKRNYLISPNGDDLNNSWTDTRPEIADYVRAGGEPQARQYCQVTQAYSFKTEEGLPYAIKSGGINGVDLSVGPREVVYPDIEPVSNSSVSPVSQAADDTPDERNTLPQGLPVMMDAHPENLAFNQSSQATQTNLPYVVGDSSGKLDGQAQTDQVGPDPSSLPSNLLKCPHCETFFTDHVIFTLHMSCHGSRHPFQCSICGYVCRDKIEFTCHITRSQHMR